MLYIILSAFIFGIILLLLRKKKKSSPSSPAGTLQSQSEIKIIKAINASDFPKQIQDILKDRYTDMEVISAGGMGMIMKAKDIEHKRTVAIKSVLPELNNNEKAIKLFFAECNAIKRMNHPNIVRIYEVGEEEALYYYVMEFLEGMNLQKLLKKEGKLSYTKAISVGVQVSRALQHCHDNQVIHRDIKPSNIFLTQNDVIKIIDFGIVKLLTGDPALLKGTTKIGSPDFASPEQIQGQNISGKSDIYALGTSLYFMLTGGHMPFKTSNLLAKMFEKPRDIKEYCPDIPNELSMTVYKCLELDPAKRYTASQLWSQFKKIQKT